METQNHIAENTISIPREKFLSMIGQLQSNFLSMVALNPQPIPPESVSFPAWLSRQWTDY